jgi:hypothetical protein
MALFSTASGTGGLTPLYEEMFMDSVRLNQIPHCTTCRNLKVFTITAWSRGIQGEIWDLAGLYYCSLHALPLVEALAPNLSPIVASTILFFGSISKPTQED